MNIITVANGDVAICGPDGHVVTCEQEQRELLAYLAKNKPALVAEIVCENCPEHVG